MKIYQLHRYSGEWEDFCDDIYGSYLRKEKAEEEKNKAEAKEKELDNKGRKCMYCPFFGEDTSELDELLSENPNYCSEMKLKKSDYGIDCENYYSRYCEDVTFKIIEVEVEE